MTAVIAQWIHLSLPFCGSSSNPMHNIYTFSIHFWIVIWKGQNKQKEAEFGPHIKNVVKF